MFESINRISNCRIECLNCRIEGLNWQIEGWNCRIEGLNWLIECLNWMIASLDCKIDCLNWRFGFNNNKFEFWRGWIPIVLQVYLFAEFWSRYRVLFSQPDKGVTQLRLNLVIGTNLSTFSIEWIRCNWDKTGFRQNTDPRSTDPLLTPYWPPYWPPVKINGKMKIKKAQNHRWHLIQVHQ